MTADNATFGAYVLDVLSMDGPDQSDRMTMIVARAVELGLATETDGCCDKDPWIVRR